jgi:hypothetical protein
MSFRWWEHNESVCPLLPDYVELKLSLPLLRMSDVGRPMMRKVINTVSDQAAPRAPGQRLTALGHQ